MKEKDALQELNMEKVKERERVQGKNIRRKGKLDFVGGGKRMQERTVLQ